MGNFVERRHHTRFKTKHGAIAALVTKIDLRLGVILNLSKGGLAFRYIIQDTKEALQKKSRYNIDIMLDEKSFYLEKLPCSIVSESTLLPKPSFITLPMKRCGVQFEEMEVEQKMQLETFIRDYTFDIS